MARAEKSFLVVVRGRDHKERPAILNPKLLHVKVRPHRGLDGRQAALCFGYHNL